MTATDAGTDLRLYLQDARDSLLLKLDGLSEYDVRRPLTPTGTNLLGLVKHLTGAEAIYFGETFGRPLPGAQPLWITGAAEPNADLWATPASRSSTATAGPAPTRTRPSTPSPWTPWAESPGPRTPNSPSSASCWGQQPGSVLRFRSEQPREAIPPDTQRHGVPR